MSTKSLLCIAVFLHFISINWIEAENQQQKAEGIWVLDSIQIAEINKDLSETPVDYPEVSDNLPFVFERINFLSEADLQIDKRIRKNLAGSYLLTEESFQLQIEDFSFSYRYRLTDFFTLEGEFPGGNPAGLLVTYRVFMRFRK
jgi:hypothetical protein